MAGFIGGVLLIVLMGVWGVLLVADFRGISTRSARKTDRWWSAGPIRRRLRWGVAKPRPFGAILLATAVLLLIAAIFRR
jgi:hypothetical protein